jgi:RNA polymerase sigma-70 factor (ECF subfamily)
MITQKEMTSYYEDIAPKLTSFLLANGCGYDQASDIVQETFVRLWKMRDQLTEEDSVSGLVFRIAKNLRIDAFRKNKREVLVDEYEDSTVPTVEDNLDSDQDEQYIRNCIVKALGELPEDLRVCYTMFNLGQMSIKDISASLNISESLVKVRIHRAKEKLKVSLAYLKENL